MVQLTGRAGHQKGPAGWGGAWGATKVSMVAVATS